MKNKILKITATLITIVFFFSCEKSKIFNPTSEKPSKDDISLGLGQLKVPSVYKVYMRANGSDSNSGLDSNHAVKTLSKVQSILINNSPPDDIEVHISPGIYYNQTVIWTFTNNKKITFTSKDFSIVRPVFDGQGNETWFKANISNGQNSNLNFKYIKVQNYKLGIYLNGDKYDPTNGWNGNNYLYGMYFKNIGSKFTINKDFAYAAVDLVNSRNNRIINCHFVNIENSGSTADKSHLHALYISNYSSNNIIQRNRFEIVCGDPIRTRDESNNNFIEDNNFINTGEKAFFSDWYCSPATTSSPCTKTSGECPSYGNEFRNNDCNKNYLGVKPKLFILYGIDNYCGALPGARLSTSGNVNY